MESIILERATAATQSDAARLLGAQFEEHAIVLPPAKRVAAIAGLVGEAARGFVLVARRPGARVREPLVGIAVVAYCWTVEHGGLVAWLDELYVVPELRGRGIGGALLACAMDDARAAGCAAIELEIDEEHGRAANLYLRAGFARLARTRWSLPLVPSPPLSPSSIAFAGTRPHASLDHISLGVNDVVRSRAFYDSVLAPLGLVAYPQTEGDIGYGPPGGEPKEGFALYIGFETPSERRTVTPSAGFHMALRAPDREAVRQFHRAALEAGARDLGAPGLLPRYHADYYGAFVSDPDGHHIEAVCHAPERGTTIGAAYQDTG
jgi:catechol 2,3-dioxygenase-like lactoylglutathione lyase family enzyme/GNAT superfamily N-acetyltransferase